MISALCLVLLSIGIFWLVDLFANAPLERGNEYSDDLTDGRIRNTPPVAAGLNDDGRNIHNGDKL